MKRGPFHLKVVTRGETVYEGDITSLTSVNEKGKFDILLKHANFISLIKDYLIIGDAAGGEQEIKIGRGILRVFRDRANVYLGIK